MQLLVDIGNSRIKWRWARHEVLHEGGAAVLPHEGEEQATFGRIWGHALAPTQVVVSNVKGSLIADALTAWSLATWRREPVFVVSSSQGCGVSNGYSRPSALGADRWCSLIGARGLVAGRVCVVDCGTAITLDVLDPEGRHEGGLIIPGLSTMLRAVAARARDVPPVMEPPAGATLGRTTAECLHAGIVAAAAGMVEHTLKGLAFSVEEPLLVTGGDAAILGSALGRPFHVEADLVFYGLARIATQGGCS